MKKNCFIRFFRKLGILWKKYYAVLFFLPLIAAAAWAMHLEPYFVRTVRYEVELPASAAPELDGFVIALLSDFHLNGRMETMLPEITTQTNAAKPDVILLGGDFFVNNATSGIEWIFESDFSRFSAPCGVYAVLGNHDFHVAEALRKATSSANIRLLENQTVQLQGPRGGAINLIGIDCYLDKSICRPDGVSDKSRPDMPNLVLVHDPDFIRYVRENVFLVMAGHTHGGQLSLPFYGSLLCPAHLSQKAMRGISRHGKTTLLVTSGLGNGNGFPLRFLTMPEIVLITLKHPQYNP